VRSYQATFVRDCLVFFGLSFSFWCLGYLIFLIPSPVVGAALRNFLPPVGKDRRRLVPGSSSLAFFSRVCFQPFCPNSERLRIRWKVLLGRRSSFFSPTEVVCFVFPLVAFSLFLLKFACRTFPRTGRGQMDHLQRTRDPPSGVRPLPFLPFAEF